MTLLFTSDREVHLSHWSGGGEDRAGDTEGNATKWAFIAVFFTAALRVPVGVSTTQGPRCR